MCSAGCARSADAALDRAGTADTQDEPDVQDAAVAAGRKSAYYIYKAVVFGSKLSEAAFCIVKSPAFHAGMFFAVKPRVSRWHSFFTR